MGEDVIGSGPARPARVAVAVRGSLRRVVRRLAGTGRGGRRVAAVALATAVAAAALLGLRASVPQATPAGRGGPPSSVPLGLSPTPPYDRLPGRTPIPAPSLVGEDGQTIGGELPVFAPAPSRLAVRIAVRMILNRFCREPAEHPIHLDQGVGESWRSATAVVSPPRFPLADRPMIVLRLFWTGYTYRWRGSLYQLADCG